MPTLLPHISRNLAKQLAAALAAYTWGSVPGGAIDVKMQRKPDYSLEDLGYLRVSVVPGAYTMKTETKGMEVADATVGIVVAQHVGSDAEIEAYLQAEQPYDCAGSAKSEGLGIALLDAIDNDDPTALIGLPLIRTCRILREAGISLL